MKSLRKLAGITITLILIFMVIALFRYQAGDEVSLLPEGFEFAFDLGRTGRSGSFPGGKGRVCQVPGAGC